MEASEDIHPLRYNDREITLIGTAHVSKESADLVEQVIKEQRPDTVCVELCQSRYDSITQKKDWKETDLIKVIREKKSFLLLLNLMLAYFQKKIGKKLGIKPGEEIVRAIRAAGETGAEVHLVDRDIRTTLSRTWRFMGLWTKIKLFVQMILSMGDMDDIKEEDIEKMKRKDILETLLSDLGDVLPEIRSILIDERDQYLSHKIRYAPGNRIVAVVGAGHVPGIKKYWEQQIDIESLSQNPPKAKWSGLLKWGIPIAIIAIIVIGFFNAGMDKGADMIKWWVLANACLAGIGAAAALGHPVTILSAILASPLTSLNPMVAAGWVAGLVEAFFGKPKVKDFEKLPEDISSLRGFWNNRITRVLMVVVFTNIGSSLGTFVAIPLMVKVMHN